MILIVTFNKVRTIYIQIALEFRVIIHVRDAFKTRTKRVFLTPFLIKTATKFYLFVMHGIANNVERGKKWVVTRNKRYWSKCKKRTWWQSFIFVEIHFSLDSNIFHKMCTMLYIQCQRQHWKKSSALSAFVNICTRRYKLQSLYFACATCNCRQECTIMKYCRKQIICCN